MRLNLYLAGIFLCAITINALEPRELKFQSETLAAESWRITGDTRIDNEQLLLTSQKGLVEATYYYYAMRDTRKERPGYGNFTIMVDIDWSRCQSPFFIGLIRNGSGIKLEINPSSEEARLCSFPDDASSRFQKFPLKNSNIVSVTVVNGKIIWSINQTSIGGWEGKIPYAPELTFQAFSDHGDEKIAIKRIQWKPLHLYRAYSKLEPKPGTLFPAAAEIPVRHRLGGGHNYGRIWEKNENAAIRMRIFNLYPESRRFQIKCRITDWQDRFVADRIGAVTIPGASESEVGFTLPDDQFGFFNCRTILSDENDVEIEEPKYFSYAISNARHAAELPDDAPFGVHHYPFAKLGVKHVRFWDNGTGFLWSFVEKEKGQFNFTMSDTQLEMLDQAGMSALAVLGFVPEWATTQDPPRNHYLGKGSEYPPKNIDDWSEYCFRVANRYKGKVQYYEIWNEPNNNRLAPTGFFFKSDVNQYFELLKAASIAIRRADPEAKILAPSGTGNYFPFLQRLLELGGGEYFDILSIHTYCLPFPPEIGYQFNSEKSYRSRVERSRILLKKFGEEKPIWNTEIGYGSTPRINGRFITQDQILTESLPGYEPNWRKGWPFRPVDPRRAAAFVARFGVLSAVLGVERIYYHHRLVSPDGNPFHMTPVVAWTNQMLAGARFIRRYQTPENIHIYEFITPEKRRRLAIWQLYPETLRQATVGTSRQESVDSAPLEGAEQSNMCENRQIVQAAGYFSPGVRKWMNLLLSQAPLKAFDLFGNAQETRKNYRFDENPLWLEFDTSPEFNITEAESIKDTDDSSPESFLGKFLSEVSTLPREPRMEEIFGEIKKYNLRNGILDNGSNWNGKGTLVLNGGQSIRFAPLPGSANKGRILVRARVSSKSLTFSNRYQLFQGDKEIVLDWCPILEVRQLMKTPQYTLGSGWLISGPIDPRQEIRLKSTQNNANIWAVNLIR